MVAELFYLLFRNSNLKTKKGADFAQKLAKTAPEKNKVFGSFPPKQAINLQAIYETRLQKKHDKSPETLLVSGLFRCASISVKQHGGEGGI